MGLLSLWKVKYKTIQEPETSAHLTDSKHSSANSRQVGGSHYKNLRVEPWDAMESWLTHTEFIGFLKGNIIKYIARANSGKEDHDVMIGKAEHYQQKLKEITEKYSTLNSQAAMPAPTSTLKSTSN